MSISEDPLKGATGQVKKLRAAYQLAIARECRVVRYDGAKLAPFNGPFPIIR